MFDRHIKHELLSSAPKQLNFRFFRHRDRCVATFFATSDLQLDLVTNLELSANSVAIPNCSSLYFFDLRLTDFVLGS